MQTSAESPTLVLHCYFYTVSSNVYYIFIVMYNLTDRTTAVDVIARRDAGVRWSLIGCDPNSAARYNQWRK